MKSGEVALFIVLVVVMFLGISHVGKGCSKALDQFSAQQQQKIEKQNEDINKLGFTPADVRAFLRRHPYKVTDFIDSKVVQEKFRIWAGDLRLKGDSSDN